MTPTADRLGGAAGGLARSGPPPVFGARVFPARPEQVQTARRFVGGLLAGTPVADDAMLCVSEFAGNCVSHSVSGYTGGIFTVRVEMYDGDYVWLEVADQGGLWHSSAPDGRMHGLEIVRRLASESGVAGSLFGGWEVWARLDWPGCG